MSAPVTLSPLGGWNSNASYVLLKARCAEGAVKKAKCWSEKLRDALDPIHFGFMNSLSCQAEPRQRLPDADILRGRDVMSLFTVLGVERDGPHALDRGAELMKAEIAWRLGKRHAQDSPLDWDCAVYYPCPVSRIQPRAGGYHRAGNSAEPCLHMHMLPAKRSSSRLLIWK
jgi:hypothetical protein